MQLGAQEVWKASPGVVSSASLKIQLMHLILVTDGHTKLILTTLTLVLLQAVVQEIDSLCTAEVLEKVRQSSK